MTSRAAPVLELEEIHVEGRLTDASVAFRAGSLVGVIGENGAGKSTLLDVAAGILTAERGRVSFANGGRARRTLSEMSTQERACTIASLGAEEPHTDDVFVVERIAHGLVPRAGVGWPPDDADPRVRAIAAELGLEPLLARRIGTLSSGERRRVHVARALVDGQALAYLLDEPLQGVDVARQPLVMAALKARAARGAIVVFTVHDLAAALAADRIVGLRGGRIVHDAPPSRLDGDALERVFCVRSLDVVRLGDPTRAPT